MAPGISDETWRRLREEARGAAAERSSRAEELTRQALEGQAAGLLTTVEGQLGTLNESWAVHRKPLLARTPLLGRLFSWLGNKLVPFFLQNQVAFNADASRTMQDLYRVERLLSDEQLARTDDLFTRLQLAIRGLEARVHDLEAEVAQLRQGK